MPIPAIKRVKNDLALFKSCLPEYLAWYSSKVILGLAGVEFSTTATTSFFLPMVISPVAILGYHTTKKRGIRINSLCESPTCDKL